MSQQRSVLAPERSAVHRLGAELRARRDLARLSLAGLAVRVTYNAAYLGRLERGERLPALEVVKACDAELGAGGELVRLWHVAADEERRRKARDEAVLDARISGGTFTGAQDANGSTAVGTLYRPVTAGAYPEEFGDAAASVGRLVRLDLGRDPAAAADPADPELWREVSLRWLTDPDDEPGPLLAQGLAAGTKIVRAATDMFSSYDYQFGGGRSRLLIAQVLDSDVLPTLNEVTPGSQPVAAYLSEVGALLRLAAWTAYDIGRHGLAQAYFAQALRLARAAGDRLLGGRILAGMSHQANFLGHYQRAVELARAAREGFRGQGTAAAMALAWSMEARAQASLLRRRECLHAIAEAEKSLAHSDPANEPPWLHYFDDAELHAEAAHCFRDLGDTQNACRHAELSIRTSKSLYVRSMSFVTTVQATGHLLAGDLDQATALAVTVVDTAADQVRSRRVLAYLDDFRDRLARYPDARATRNFEEYVTGRLSSVS
jgi:tetratricopeptide (TPR) repeat protein/transcriptional regulator with XRE-family HTH domain